MSNEDPVFESAKAVQEVAKTTSKAIGALEQFGGFISNYIGGSIEQAMGLFEDKLKYMRWERQVHLMQRAEQLMKDVGLAQPTRSIPLKLALPLFEAASLEDDDDLQDLWARLLVNGANGNSRVTLKRAYISILEQLTAFDASLLMRLYSLPYEEIQHNGIIVGKLPEEAAVRKGDGKEDDHLPEPSVEVKLALANLARNGCITIPTSWGGGELFKRVNPTLLGKSFVEACTLEIPGERI